MAVELHQILHGQYRATPFRKHRHAAGSKHGADVAHRVDPKRNIKDAFAMPWVHRIRFVRGIDHFFRQKRGCGRTARNGAEHFALPDNPSADFVNELVERDTDA